MNILKSSYINPLQTYDLNHVNLPQYQSLFMDDYLFVDQIKEWQQKVTFDTKWLKSDGIRLQYITNYTPITLKVYTKDGTEIFSQVLDTRQQDFFNPGFFIRQLYFDNNILDYGCYDFKVVTGSGLILHSECVNICQYLPDTLLLQYTHYEKYQGLFFQSPFEPMLRVPGGLVYLKTAMKATVYEDQPLNETMVKAIPYRIFKFILGGSEGVPPFLIDKVARIFGCNEVRIDGRYYTKNGEGAEFEANEIEGYPMAGWSIELREKYNRDGTTYQDEVIVGGKVFAGAVISTKGFGDQQEDYDTILDVN